MIRCNQINSNPFIPFAYVSGKERSRGKERLSERGSNFTDLLFLASSFFIVTYRDLIQKEERERKREIERKKGREIERKRDREKERKRDRKKEREKDKVRVTGLQ